METLDPGFRRNALIGVLGLNVLFLAGLPFFAKGSWSAHAWSDSFWIAAGAFAVAGIGAVWRTETNPAARRGWFLVGIAAAFWFVGILIWAWNELVALRYSPSPGPADIGPIAFGIFSIPGVVGLMRPANRRPKTSGIQAVEMAISIGILILTVGILFYVPVAELTGSRGRLLVPAVNTLTYSIGLMLGIFFLSQGRPKASWSAAICVLLGLAVNVAAHFGYFYAYILGKYEAGQLIDVLWVSSFSALGFAALEELGSREGPRRTFLAREHSRYVSAIYWAFFLGCLAVGLWGYRDLIPPSQFAMLALGFVLTLLIIVYLEMRWMREIALRTRVENALRVRDEFLAMASHELKTPLTPLAGNLFLLETLDREGKLESFDPKQRTETIRSARRQVDYLYRLIEGLLSARRLAEGAIELRRGPADLVEIAKNVVERNREDLARSKCELRLELPDRAPGEWDALRLEQVVTNLLANAIKFGRGKPITVRLVSDADAYLLAVEDEGVGIHPRDHAKIFEQFGRAAPSANYAGFGLGLFIAKQIAVAHGASLEVESEPGKGSRFTLRLPRR